MMNHSPPRSLMFGHELTRFFFIYEVISISLLFCRIILTIEFRFRFHFKDQIMIVAHYS